MQLSPERPRHAPPLPCCSPPLPPHARTPSTYSQTCRQTLELVHADIQQLLSGVGATAQLAERISSQVRRLDAAQGRVQDTISVISLILDRANCIAGVQSALDGGDYESAARWGAVISCLVLMLFELVMQQASHGGGH